MTIEIHQPKLEAIIHLRMKSGRFESMEDMLMQALEPVSVGAAWQDAHRTGADLVAAMQAMPWKDEIEFEHSRPHLPVSDVAF